MMLDRIRPPAEPDSVIENSSTNIFRARRVDRIRRSANRAQCPLRKTSVPSVRNAVAGDSGRGFSQRTSEGNSEVTEACHDARSNQAAC